MTADPTRTNTDALPADGPAASATARPRRVTGAPSTMGDDVQLNTTTFIRHAARTYGEQEIVYRTADDGWARTTYADEFERIQRGANLLTGLGIGPGDRVGVLDWNSRRHFELYWSIPGTGAAMIQLNLRLGPEDMGFVLEDSGTSVVFVDESLLPVAEAVAPTATQVETWVVMSDRPLAEVDTSLINVVHFEDLLAAADRPSTGRRSPRIAFAACYTTGTTGKPKGVFYSHRSICLHTCALTQGVGLGSDDCIMLITPMFHGSGWGDFPKAPSQRTKIVLPGRYRAEDTGPLVEAMAAEGVTVANGAPAIFNPMVDHIRTMDPLPDFRGARFMSGATEPSLTLMRDLFELTGAEVVHAYGATETSPLVTLNRFKPSVRKALSEDELFELKRKQDCPWPASTSSSWTDRQCRAVRREVTRRDLRARTMDHRHLQRNERRRPRRTLHRRLLALRRRRHHRRTRLPQDHRPAQGRHQVRRRVDLVDRHGEPSCSGHRTHRRCRGRRAQHPKWQEAVRPRHCPRRHTIDLDSVKPILPLSLPGSCPRRSRSSTRFADDGGQIRQEAHPRRLRGLLPQREGTIK